MHSRALLQSFHARQWFLTRCFATRSTTDALQFDRHHIWHPYTSLTKAAPPSSVLPVHSASGCKIRLESGEELIDGMSSWWSTIHGYNHPRLNQALEKQASRMSHVMFGGLTHRPAIDLASLLIDITPASLTKVFFADSGSVSVEVAMKMALQYHRGVGSQRKTKFMTLRSGYHGDTFGAMSVCDPVTGMHSAFQSNLMANIFVSRPPCDPATRLSLTTKCHGCISPNCEDTLEQAIAEMEQTLAENEDSVAAFVVEPIVQGAGGMRFYEAEYLRRAREACTRHNVLLICDEIATGLGRTGALFASLDVVEPDIMCLGKALTGGTMSLAVTMATESVAEGVSAQPPETDANHSVKDVPLPLMHGPTFMANPLGCAVSLESVSMLLETNEDFVPWWKAAVDRVESGLREALAPAVEMDAVADVRVKGAIGVIELKEPIDNSWVTPMCVELGVWLRPFGRLLYTMPPYVASDSDLRLIANAMMRIAEKAGTSS